MRWHQRRACHQVLRARRRRALFCFVRYPGTGHRSRVAPPRRSGAARVQQHVTNSSGVATCRGVLHGSAWRVARSVALSVHAPVCFSAAARRAPQAGPTPERPNPRRGKSGGKCSGGKCSKAQRKLDKLLSDEQEHQLRIVRASDGTLLAEPARGSHRRSSTPVHARLPHAQAHHAKRPSPLAPGQPPDAAAGSRAPVRARRRTAHA